MALSAGTRLGPYEIQAAIGTGGMGKVYRATDTRLGRDVAIKVQPDAFAADTDRVARIEREARALAALNHPNVALIYGLEDAAGSRALVLELVEGPTLADRLAHGPLPLDEALGIANQIAGALDAAHSQRIIHRDLKPANIKVRDDGIVKVLDFGLAKALDEASEAGGDDLLNSPTITSPAETQRESSSGRRPT
jgi:eukaryotic-like serine/threonine-protein kinase